ncbi:MAG TPA: hypothetical protein VJ740_02245, partial [Hyphomicrobiaceae bacterium]|nr:hypothetical protein [Hyphomicrobiaceae bacterium]
MAGEVGTSPATGGHGMGRGKRRFLMRAGFAAAFSVCVGFPPLATRAVAQAGPNPPVPVPHEVHARIPPLRAARSALVAFDLSPFPYEGVVPRTQRPFFDVTDEDGRRGHSSSRAGVLWEDDAYSDKRALLFLPKGFDVRRPGVIVVFLHGNRATLERDVTRRQRVVAQIEEANVNAALVAPQLAVNANDSSAGRFWETYGFARFIGEAGAHLAHLYGDRRTRKTFATLPVIIVAYSGGYVPAAWALYRGGSDARVIGVLLLDALYGEVDKYADFIARNPKAFFISAYTSSSARGNETLQQALAERDRPFATSLPPRLQGTVAFLRTTGADHENFVTHAWVDDPIRDVLERLGGYRRYPG